ncbi:helix-turn-helix domain-containing protein [Pseudomonas oligotrophica]|uniref:helix-turn-helix domain-containing protein n=1 Tax=Pseudomonas oligotrophica TaxID=2912055 RepID=UPI001F2911D7|nr:helix-turn-helix transcriptional regulator [Pseudomonas oligotrophica]MCF7202519.1 helix-turn-helix domain-containing protein [Pseudomonas oligotrophica]
MELRKAFGQALKRTRTSHGLTQEDFSEVSSRTYLSTLERGLKSPTLDKLDEIAAVMDVHPVSLLLYTYALQRPDQSIDEILRRVRKDLSELS